MRRRANHCPSVQPIPVPGVSLTEPPQVAHLETWGTILWETVKYKFKGTMIFYIKGCRIVHQIRKEDRYIPFHPPVAAWHSWGWWRVKGGVIMIFYLEAITILLHSCSPYSAWFNQSMISKDTWIMPVAKGVIATGHTHSLSKESLLHCWINIQCFFYLTLPISVLKWKTELLVHGILHPRTLPVGCKSFFFFSVLKMGCQLKNHPFL